MGSIEQPSSVSGVKDVQYSVPAETYSVFKHGILENPLIASSLPPEALGFSTKVSFTGSALPSIPINWRFAESAASLKGLEAILVAALIKRKYGREIGDVEINTDHAQLFFMSTLLWQMDVKGKYGDPIPFGGAAKIDRWFPNCDLHGAASSHHRSSATNIYRTQDGKFFHLHGSLNPEPTLDSVGLPHNAPAATPEESWQPFMSKMSTIDSAEMQHQATDIYKQAGTICETVSSFQSSEHGKANAHIALFDVHDLPNPSQKPSWWLDSLQNSPKRPLAGLKVVDLTRIIAAPAVTRGLAELGASVMRVTSPNITDMSSLHPDLNWGKWNCHLNLKDAGDREKLKNLVLEADVVVQGYRPGVLDKYGFGVRDVVELCKNRERGIISARENCYGWQGPWSHRSGWQQISDACVGISHEFGKAMGLVDGEAVTPVFPNSDYMTGIAGVSGILCALLQRAEKGGSYQVDLALNYYNQWLANSVGTYPEEVWQDVWSRNGRQVFRSYHNMSYTIPRFMGMITQNSADKLFKPEFFEDRECRNLDIHIRAVKPVINFKQGDVVLKYNVGTRGNGVDKAEWPADLNTEVVK